MNYLVDTHTLLWVLQEPDKLSRVAKRGLTDVENNIFVSPISFWEVALKYSKGKIDLQDRLPDELPLLAKHSRFILSKLTVGLVASFYKLRKTKHADPFDRMLVWQAINEKMTLVSKDKSLGVYKKDGLKMLW